MARHSLAEGLKYNYKVHTQISHTHKHTHKRTCLCMRIGKACSVGSRCLKPKLECAWTQNGWIGQCCRAGGGRCVQAAIPAWNAFPWWHEWDIIKIYFAGLQWLQNIPFIKDQWSANTKQAHSTYKKEEIQLKHRFKDSMPYRKGQTCLKARFSACNSLACIDWRGLCALKLRTNHISFVEKGRTWQFFKIISPCQRFFLPGHSVIWVLFGKNQYEPISTRVAVTLYTWKTRW